MPAGSARKRAGPAPTAISAPARPASRTAMRPAVSAISRPVLAATSAKLTSQTPPAAASASTAGCCHWLAPSTAHGPPSPARTGSTRSPASSSARRQARRVPGRRSPAAAATTRGDPDQVHSEADHDGDQQQAGPEVGQPASTSPPAGSRFRTTSPGSPPPAALGATCIRARPGTSPNHARNSRFGRGEREHRQGARQQDAIPSGLPESTPESPRSYSAAWLAADGSARARADAERTLLRCRMISASAQPAAAAVATVSRPLASRPAGQPAWSRSPAEPWPRSPPGARCRCWPAACRPAR